MKLFYCLFSFITACFLFAACGSSTESVTSQKESVQIGESEAQKEMLALGFTQEQYDNIVNKGGAKADNQILLEELLIELNAQKKLYANKPIGAILGHFVGAFGKNKINITLTQINEASKTAKGYSVCAGNFRRLEGTYTLINDQYTFVLNEPGDDKYDGMFEFIFDPIKSKIIGNWTPFEQKGNTPRSYSLDKKDFNYNVNYGNFDASKRVLSEEDMDLMLDEYELMRNEIYARHGYSFKNKKMRAHFEKQDWYMPMGIDIRHELTDTEIANIGLIYEYESYYLEYMDDYGR